MTDLTAFFKTDLVDDHVADDVNVLIAAALRAEFANTETITGTKALTDNDCQLQLLTASGADRTMNLAAEASGNHVTIIENASASNSIYVKDDSGTTTYIVLAPGDWAMFLPFRSAWHLAAFSSYKTGWNPVAEAWTYLSSNQVTVPTDATTRYQVGDKIRLKQGGGFKYFSVIALTATVLTLYAGSDNVVANATITDVSFSRQVDPYGWPGYFNFTPTWAAGVTVGNATVAAKVSIEGRVVKGNVSFAFAAAGVTSAITGQITLTPPVTILSSLTSYTTVGAAACVDFGVALYMGETVDVAGALELRVINAAGTYALWSATSSTVPFTWAANDLFTMEFSYLI